MINTYSIPSHN